MRMNMMRIPCSDLKKTENFYSEKLGLSKIFGSSEDGFIGYQLDNVQLLLEAEEKGEFESGRFLGFSLEVSDIYSFYGALRKQDVIFSGPPEKQFWGGVMTHITDSSNNTFSVVQIKNNNSLK